MNINEIKRVLSSTPAMSFTEIGEELGVSGVRAHQIFHGAVEKIVRNLTEEERMEIKELLAELKPEENMYELMTEQMFLPDDSDNLRGFWNEEEAKQK